jgi:hypothetical protein
MPNLMPLSARAADPNANRAAVAHIINLFISILLLKLTSGHSVINEATIRWCLNT